MDLLQKSLKMIEKHPLCDRCLGRQFALLGYGVENEERGRSIKLALTLKAQDMSMRSNEGVKALKILASNGFSEIAQEVLRKMKRRLPGKGLKKQCFLCEDRMRSIEQLADKASALLNEYEYNNFLVGIELPVNVEEREDEFKAEFAVDHGENMRNEFGRLIGKKVAEQTGRPAEFMKPDVVVLVSPYAETVKLRVNPLFVSGRYRKIARGIPQSKWFCSECRGRGCERCGWTGKMYPESVEEIIGKPFLDATGGIRSSFHAAGREDIDARMLGAGRPYVIEIERPRRRFLDMKKLEEHINAYGKGKVEVSSLAYADKEGVRKLKKAESTQKKYRVTIKFEKNVTSEELNRLKSRLTNTIIVQETPLRVLHRRADLTREKYIYDVDVKRLSSNKIEMKLRCQGGLYVKELVTGDEGRTRPSASEILGNRARPLKLDVLNVIMADQEVTG
jgi:tRNA pseudouridine synthase 10